MFIEIKIYLGLYLYCNKARVLVSRDPFGDSGYWLDIAILIRFIFNRFKKSRRF